MKPKKLILSECSPFSTKMDIVVPFRLREFLDKYCMVDDYTVLVERYLHLEAQPTPEAFQEQLRIYQGKDFLEKEQYTKWLAKYHKLQRYDEEEAVRKEEEEKQYSKYQDAQK